MFNESVSVDFNANMAPFSASITQAINQLEAMGRASGGGIASLNKLNNVSLSVIKNMTGIAGATKSATEQAAAYQQKLAGINALATAAGKQFDGLGKVTAKFARDFPVGMDKAIETTKTLATSGVTTTKEIEKLGKTFIKLQAATGEWGSSMTQDMLQVTRTFGNSNKQIDAFSDSLVTVTSKFGASAGSVLAFTKSIAPVSNAVGLSQTSVLGLSTAFSRLGEDGYRSANAFSKVLLDLGKSVRTGSPEMRTYADVLNMTSDSLGELFKQDPSAVIVKFAETINKQGSSAIHTLDRLGLDGVNTFKSIQALASGGDLQKMMETANNAYGNNTATDAAKEALGGVNDKLADLGEKMTQTVSSAGTPFLGMLEKLLGIANKFADVIFRIVDSPLGKFFSVAAAGAGALMGSLKALSLYSFAKLGLNKLGESNLAETFRAGKTAGAKGEKVDFTSKDGLLYNFGKIFSAIKSVKGDGPGIIAENGGGVKGIFETAKNMAIWGATAATNIQTNTLQMTPGQMDNRQRTQAGMNLSNRLALARAGMDLNLDKDATAVAKAAAGDKVSPTEQLKGTIKALQMFGKDIGIAGDKGKELSGALKELSKSFLKSAGSAIGDTAKIVGKGAVEIGKALGPQIWATAGITVATKVYETWKNNKENQNANYEKGIKDANNLYNAFAEKAGLKTLGTLSAPEQTKALANSVAGQNKTIAEALKLTSQELGASKVSGYEASFKTQQNNAQDVATALRLTLGNNADPQAISRALMDVVNQKDDKFGQDVANFYSNFGNDKKKVYEKGFSAEDDSRGWFQRAFSGSGIIGEKKSTEDIINGMVSEFTRNTDAVTNTYGSNAEVVSAAKLREANNLYKGASKSASEYDPGSNSRVNIQSVLNKVLEKQLGVEGIGANAVDEYGKERTFVEALRARYKEAKSMGDKDTVEKMRPYMKTLMQTNDLKNIDFFGLSGNNLTIQEQNVVTQKNNMRDRGFTNVVKGVDVLQDSVFGAEHLARKFGTTVDDLTDAQINNSKTGLNAVQKAFLALEKAPNDIAKQIKAGNLLLEKEMQTFGNNYGAIKGSIFTALKGTDTTDPRFAAYMQALQTTNLRFQTESAGMTLTEKGSHYIEAGRAARAAGPSNDPAIEQARQQSLLEEQQYYSQVISFAKQFLEAKNNLDLQIKRQRAAAHLQEMRSNRDFNLQIKYQNEDFALMRKRAAEDFSKSVYSPFQRIAAVRTTDASSLIGNLSQQSKTLREQMKNVGILNKKFKLSKETIAMLDLMNPAMAQEVARLVMDFSNNPALASQVEAEADTRGRLASQYITSPYNQQQTRILDDFEKGQIRITKAHKTSLHDMEINLKISISQAYQDLARFGTEVAVPANQVASRLKGAFSQMPKDAKTFLSKALAELSTGFAAYVAPTVQPPVIQRQTSFGNAIAGYTGNTVNKITGQNGTVVDEKGDVQKVGVNSNYVKKSKNMPRAVYEQKIKHAQKAAAALNLQGSLYQYGDQNKFDESGILNAIGIPGTAASLKSSSNKISASQANQGDLMFFTSTDGTKGVAMVIAPGMVVAAPQWGAAILAQPIENFPGTKTYGALRYATGGHVQGPGTGTSDSIPARLSHGEYVVKADSVSKYGVNLLDGINEQKFATGGFVKTDTDEIKDQIDKNRKAKEKRDADKKRIESLSLLLELGVKRDLTREFYLSKWSQMGTTGTDTKLRSREWRWHNPEIFNPENSQKLHNFRTGLIGASLSDLAYWNQYRFINKGFSSNIKFAQGMLNFSNEYGMYSPTYKNSFPEYWVNNRKAWMSYDPDDYGPKFTKKYGKDFGNKIKDKSWNWNFSSPLNFSDIAQYLKTHKLDDGIRDKVKGLGFKDGGLVDIKKWLETSENYYGKREDYKFTNMDKLVVDNWEKLGKLYQDLYQRRTNNGPDALEKKYGSEFLFGSLPQKYINDILSVNNKKPIGRGDFSTNKFGMSNNTPGGKHVFADSDSLFHETGHLLDGRLLGGLKIISSKIKSWNGFRPGIDEEIRAEIWAGALSRLAHVLPLRNMSQAKKFSNLKTNIWDPTLSNGDTRYFGLLNLVDKHGSPFQNVIAVSKGYADPAGYLKFLGLKVPKSIQNNFGLLSGFNADFGSTSQPGRIEAPGNTTRPSYFADGGHVQGAGTGTSDSIPARLSHGEYVVKADAVNQYGTHFFDELNNQRYAKVNYLNAGEVKSNGMRHYGSSVTNTTSTQYDHSTQINGQITVQASDPNEFLRKINSQQRRQRLIQPVGN